MRTPGKMPGARGNDTGSSLDGDGFLFTPRPRKLQARLVVDADHRARRVLQARAIGPGERARSRELRRRKLHLRLIEAWRS